MVVAVRVAAGIAAVGLIHAINKLFIDHKVKLYAMNFASKIFASKLDIILMHDNHNLQ